MGLRDEGDVGIPGVLDLEAFLLQEQVQEVGRVGAHQARQIQGGSART